MRSLLVTADVQVKDSKVRIMGYQLYPDGTNAATLTLYNEADSSKTATQRVSAARVAGTESKEVYFNKPLVCEAGCYADIAGTDAIAFIFIE